MRPLARLVGVAAASALLAGCAPSVDTDQARLCRIALPALWPNAERFVDLSQSAFPDGRGLRIDFQTAPPSKGSPFITCAFKAPGRPKRAEDIVSIETNAETLGPVRLYMLERFWLGTPEGRAADPAPLGDVSRLPDIPPAAAYLLQQIIDGLPLAGVYALVAAAYSLIYGLVGRINLAFGAFVAAGGYALAIAAALIAPQWPLALAALGTAFALATSAVWGRASSAHIFERLRGATGQQNLVASIGLALAMSELMRLADGPRLAWVSPMFDQPAAVVRAGDFLVTATPMALIVSLAALTAGLALILGMRRTLFGKRWRAMADDALAASMCGISPQAIFRASFALASALAGLAGALMTLSYGAIGYADGMGIGLKALVAAVLGGIGSIEGALLGGVILGLAEALWSGYFAADYRDAAIFALLVMLLTLRPFGLLGARDAGQLFSLRLNRHI